MVEKLELKRPKDYKESTIKDFIEASEGQILEILTIFHEVIEDIIPLP